MAVAETFVRLPVKAIISSDTNPRKHFDEAALADLMASVKDKGVIEPIVVRALAKGRKGATHEIVAGERRWRASCLAALEDIPAIVREYSDEQVLEIQLVENIQRDALTPLEQAAGFRRLIDSNPDKHTAATIAGKLGVSVDVVWDILSLNNLILDAKLLLQDRLILKGHAILIARQKAEVQQQIIKRPTRSYPRVNSALWQEDDGRLDLAPGEKKGPYDGLKAVSVRELQTWIEDHVRFDVAHAATAQPFAFEETAAVVATALEQPGRGAKTLAITYDYRVGDDARAEHERTFGVNSWVRADGEKKSRTCEFSKLGLVVAGKGQGESFLVCVNRDKCTTHFGKVIKERAKNEKLRTSGKGKTAATREAAQRRREETSRAREVVKEARRRAIGQAAEAAFLEKVKGLKKVSPALLGAALQHVGLPVKTKVADLPKALVLEGLRDLNFVWSGGEKEVKRWAGLLGINLKAIEKAVDEEAAKKAPKPAADVEDEEA